MSKGREMCACSSLKNITTIISLFKMDDKLFENDTRVVGKRLKRKDAEIKITGEAQYVYDLLFADERYLKVVRSPYARAIIKKIEIDHKKLKSLGVVAGTAAEIPGKNSLHVMHDDWPLLAEKMVNHVGEPVVVLIGPTPQIAEKARDYVKIEYNELPAIFDPIEAKDHPLIHIYGDNNVCSYWQQKKGDVQKGFSESDIIIENEYRTPAQEHAYIETQGCIAVPIGHDEITVYGSMQCPFYVQRCVAEILGMEYSKIKIIQTTTGGAFGGKEDVPSQIGGLAAFGAWLVKKPVKYMLTREEDFETTSKRHPAVIRYKTGLTKKGELKAVRVEIFLNTGAYATLGPAVLFRAALHSVGPYRCENVDVQAYAVTTNLVPFGAFRGFGGPQVIFAAEEQMDRAAGKLGLDPSEFRELHMLKVGDSTTFGQKLNHSVGLEKTLRAARDQSGWYEKRKPAPSITQILEDQKNGKYLHRGIGISTIFYGCFIGASGKDMSRSGAYVQLEPDGSVRFSVGTTEMGQGMITVLSQIVAEELDIEYDKVHMTPVDTSRVPDSGPTVASRATVMSGRALQDACKQLRQLLFEIGGNDPTISVTEAIKLSYHKRGRVAAHGWDVAPPTFYDNEKGQGDAYSAYAWATNIIEVEVDSQTGTVDVINIWAAHDVGKAINPQTVEGQIEGGSLQGLGYGRYEQIVFTRNGRVLSNNLGTYLIPTAKDTPNIHSIIVEEPWIEGPYGAKGIGEPPIIGIAPALTNAIANAVGIRLNEIPATPERVWAALQEKIREARK
jgi:CO/xanthine dehydrogenase Mo-binding subunit